VALADRRITVAANSSYNLFGIEVRKAQLA